MINQNGKIRKISALLIAIAFMLLAVFSNSAIFSADAGASKIFVVSDASIRGNEINQGDFKIDGGVYAKDGKAVFDKSVSQSARLLAKARVNNLKDYGVKELFDMTADFEFERLVSGGSASFVFGLKKFSDNAKSKDSVEVAFTYENDCICIAVNEYKTANVATVVAAKHSYNMFSLNSEITLKIKVDVNGKAYVSVQSATSGVGEIYILNGKTLGVDADGFVAFVSSSTGSADANKNLFKVSEIAVTAFAYELVETVDHYVETFDNNTYNANMFYSQTTNSPISPARIAAEDGKLVFGNVGQGYFTTREQYSNFELKFDIVDMYREGKKDANGNITQLISHWFMIGFGVDNYNDPPSERIQATFLQFEGLPGSSDTNRSNHMTGEVDNAATKDRYVLWNNSNAVNGAIKGMSGDKTQGIFSLWDKDYIGNQTVNLKFTVIDGVITLYYKLASQDEYVMQYQYDLGTMQTGYVRIYSYGQGDGAGLSEYTCVLNMTIDNFEITNLDNDAVKLVKAAPVYKSNIQPETKDYDYTTVPDASDLLKNKLKK